MTSIKTGAVFETFEALKEAVKKEEENTFCKYTIARSSALRFKGQDTTERRDLWIARKKLLQFESLSFSCKHGEVKQTRKTNEIRIQQNTYKLGCAAGFEVRLAPNGKGLIIKECNIGLEVHKKTHNPTPRDYEQLPEVRRLNDADSARITELRTFGATAMKIRNVISKETGKVVLVQDLQNVKTKVRAAEALKYINVPKDQIQYAQACEEFEDMQSKDPEGFYRVLTTGENFVAFVLVTSKMMTSFKKFPEVMAFDATYNRNKLKLPIITYISIDGRGEGRVIGYAIVSNERLETVTSTLAALKEAHKMADEEVKTVLVDKDMSEIAAVKEVFPSAQLTVCLFHSKTNIMKALKKEINDSNLRAKVEVAVEDLLFKSYTEDDYNKYLVNLKELLPQDDSFLSYFLKNWHESRDMWAPYCRANALHFGVRTTNHVESHNKILLSQLGKKERSLKETLHVLKMIENSVSDRQQHNQHQIRVKLPVRHGAQSYCSEVLIGHATDYCIDLLTKQEKFHGQVSVASLQKYSTTTTSCKCNFFMGVGLPCCHQMFVRKELQLPIVSQQDLKERWLLSYQLEEGARPELSNTQESEYTVRASKAPLNKEQKYTQVLRVCKEICDHASEFGGRQYDNVLINLNKIKDLMIKHGGFTVEGGEAHVASGNGPRQVEAEDADLLSPKQELVITASSNTNVVEVVDLDSSEDSNNSEIRILTPSLADGPTQEQGEENQSPLSATQGPPGFTSGTARHDSADELDMEDLNKTLDAIEAQHASQTQKTNFGRSSTEDILEGRSIDLNDQMIEADKSQQSIVVAFSQQEFNGCAVLGSSTPMTSFAMNNEPAVEPSLNSNTDQRTNNLVVKASSGKQALTMFEQKKITGPQQAKTKGRPKGSQNVTQKSIKEYFKHKDPIYNLTNVKLAEKVMEHTNLTEKIASDLLDSKEMITDDVFTEVLKLLNKDKFQGFHPPAVGKVGFPSYDYTKGGLYVQPMHASLHWVVVTFDGKIVQYYDSLAKRGGTNAKDIPEAFVYQISSIVNSQDGEILIHHMQCELQTGAINCGLFALSNMIDFYLDGQLDYSSRLNVASTRKYIARMLITKLVSSAPKISKRGITNRAISVLHETKIDVYCFCRMPERYSKWMIQCPRCNNWLHGKCINHPEADKTVSGDMTFNDIPDFVCPICIQLFKQ